jgi:predicted porin/type II secretory pathway pseudopilin PulG
MSKSVTRSQLLLAVSALAISAVAVPAMAKADSISDLQVQLNIIESQIKGIQAQSHSYSPAKRDELNEVKAEVAQLKAQLAEVQAEPKPAPVRTYDQQLAASLPPAAPGTGISFNGGTSPLGPKYQKPIVGGIPIITTPGGAFFIAGTIDAGVRVDSGAGHSIFSVQSGLMRASRLTLEGYQSVGWGLRVVGVLEGGINVAEGIGASNPSAAGASFDFGRESFAGIGSDKTGYIDFGRQYSPIWAVSAAPTADPFAGNYLGGIVAFDPTLAVNSRVSNAITYNYRYTWEGMLDPSPSHGFGFAALFSPGGQTGTKTDPSNAGQQFGASASYGTKHFWIGAGYHQIDGWNSNVAPYSNTYIPATSNKTALIEETVAVSYLTPFARLFAQYNSQDDGRKVSLNDGVDQNDWFVGFVAPTFPHQNLRFTYGTFYNHTDTKAQYSMAQASYEYDLVQVPGTALYLEGLLVSNNKHSAQGILGAANVGGTGPAAILPDQLTANGTTLDYGATASSIAAGIRFIF